ncbi:MAG: Dihydrolipoamide acetyltransferase [Deltaproteobacteria bacterium]|nr:Dihydrolipoamide acetyltransferase [Deltaproteobacteria bacterium]
MDSREVGGVSPRIGARIGTIIGAVLVCATRLSLAQTPPDSPPPSLAQIKDDQQLDEMLSAITQDPAIPVADPAMRPLAQALMIEGVRQLQAKAYEQALANFLEAYARLPSPKILLDVASILRDMGRIADAANTYQRYLTDPKSGADRVAEVKQLLLRLDEQVTILTVRVVPRGSEISIDAGPFIAVGSTLVTRVSPGLHLVRIRKQDLSSELTVNGFEGETKEVSAALRMAPPAPTPTPQPADHQDGWLITGQYGSTTGNPYERTVLTGYAGAPISAIVPAFDVTEAGEVVVHHPGPSISAGLLGVVRIDAEGRGFAGGLGLAISHGRFEGDVLMLRSSVTGGYLGLRYRFLGGLLRPYAAIGLPGFVFDNKVMDKSETRLAIGLRGAGGLELMVNGHLSIQADFGFEHFWFVKDTRFVSNVWVPTVGVIGRL